MGVGFARMRMLGFCQSMRITNPHHRCAVPTPVGSAYGRAIRTLLRRLMNHCRICANPLGLRITRNAPYIGLGANICTTYSAVYIILNIDPCARSGGAHTLGIYKRRGRLNLC